RLADAAVDESLRPDLRVAENGGSADVDTAQRGDVLAVVLFYALPQMRLEALCHFTQPALRGGGRGRHVRQQDEVVIGYVRDHHDVLVGLVLVRIERAERA